MNKELAIYRLFNACDEFNHMRERLEVNPLELEELNEKETPVTKLQELFSKLILIETDEKAMLEGIEEQILYLEIRKKRIKARINNIRTTILNAMKICDIEKIKCPIATISRSISAPKVCIKNIHTLLFMHPEYFIEQAPKVDKKLLLNDLKEGILIDGAHLEKDETIIIRKK